MDWLGISKVVNRVKYKNFVCRVFKVLTHIDISYHFITKNKAKDKVLMELLDHESLLLLFSTINVWPVPRNVICICANHFPLLLFVFRVSLKR